MHGRFLAYLAALLFAAICQSNGNPCPRQRFGQLFFVDPSAASQPAANKFRVPSRWGVCNINCIKIATVRSDFEHDIENNDVVEGKGGIQTCLPTLETSHGSRNPNGFLPLGSPRESYIG